MSTSEGSGRTRRKFTPEFKAEVVAMVEASGGKIAQVAREMRLHDSSVGNWVREAREAREARPARRRAWPSAPRSASCAPSSSGSPASVTLGKSSRLLLGVAPEERVTAVYTFIAEEQADPACDWSLTAMCRVLEVRGRGSATGRTVAPRSATSTTGCWPAVTVPAPELPRSGSALRLTSDNRFAWPRLDGQSPLDRRAPGNAEYDRGCCSREQAIGAPIGVTPASARATDPAFRGTVPDRFAERSGTPFGARSGARTRACSRRQRETPRQDSTTRRARATTGLSPGEAGGCQVRMVHAA